MVFVVGVEHGKDLFVAFEFIELVQFGPQQPLVRELQPVFGDERGGGDAAHGVLDNFVVLGLAKQYADAGVLVWFPHVPVQRFEVEVELADVFGFERSDLQLNGDQAVDSAMIKQQINEAVASSDLYRILLADEGEVAPQLPQEPSEPAHEASAQIVFGMIRRKIEELDDVAVLEGASGLRRQFLRRCCEFMVCVQRAGNR